MIRLLGPPFIVLHALFLIRVKSGYRRAVAGMVMYTTALLLFWSCASNTKTKHLSLVFSGDVPDRLRVDGPYRYLRHPFYGSYCLAWFSGAAASGNGWLLLSALLMTAIYSMAAHMEEVGFASSPLASQYAAYRVRTGMFIPRLPGAGRRR